MRAVVVPFAFAFAFAFALAASGTALAQPSLSPPNLSPPSMTAPVQQTLSTEPLAFHRKDPSTAVLLSIGVTTAGFVTFMASHDEHVQLLGFAGMFFGPSTGLWYAGEVGGLGMGLRLLSIVSIGYGVTQILSAEDDCFDDCSGGADHSASDEGALFLIGGAGLWIGSSIADVILAKRAVDHYNARESLSMSPMVIRDAAGNRNAGFAVSGRF